MKKTLPFLSFSLSFSLSFFLFLSFFIFCVPTGVAMATPATPSNTPLLRVRTMIGDKTGVGVEGFNLRGRMVTRRWRNCLIKT